MSLLYLAKDLCYPLPDFLCQHCRYLEAFCSHTFANFGETLYLRRVIVGVDGLEMATKSLLRVKMHIEGDQVFQGSEFTEGEEYSRHALKRILENALHTVCKYVCTYLPMCVCM